MPAGALERYSAIHPTLFRSLSRVGSAETSPLPYRYLSNWIAAQATEFEKLLEVGRTDMVVQRPLILEYLIEHEAARLFRILVQKVIETSGFLSGGDQQRVELAGKVLFSARSRCHDYIQNDGFIALRIIFEHRLPERVICPRIRLH